MPKNQFLTKMAAKTTSGSGLHFRFVFYALDFVENEHNIEGLRKNERQEAAGGQTGSGNLAATPYFDSAIPISYSPSYTLWGLSLTVTELVFENVNITPC